MKKLPSNYPHKYFPHGNNSNSVHPTIIYIRYAVTPTGRIGKDFEQLCIYKKPGGRFANMSQVELDQYAAENIGTHRLPKGNVWGEIFIQSQS